MNELGALTLTILIGIVVGVIVAMWMLKQGDGSDD